MRSERFGDQRQAAYTFVDHASNCRGARKYRQRGIAQDTPKANKRAPDVRKSNDSIGKSRPFGIHAAVSPKAARSTAAKKIDRRVLRTRDVLGDALIALMHEKPFVDITVQQVLDRTEVGRSTFYSHYSDKNDLFLSDVEDFWEAMSTLLPRCGEDSDRVAPVRELFSHVAEARVFYSTLVTSGKIHEVLDLGRGFFARAIGERLGALPRAHGTTAERCAALAHAYAGALFSLMSWWIDRGMRASPAEMDDVFHQMIWSGVSSRRGETHK